MKVAFTTLGCRVNQYETEAMIEKFVREGYELSSFEDFADVYVINTCTVTNMGDKKSRQMINRARRENENSIIAVVGCYSQIAPDEISKIEGVDVILGTRNKGDIVYWVNRAREENKQIIKVEDVLKNSEFEDLNINEYQDRTRAFIKIQDGCNRFCSYCLIPFARGAVCSKEPEKVLKEVKELANNNFKEIILSGIHIASYGLDLEGEWNLVRMLEEIDKIHGIERVRIGSIDPQFFTEGVIEKISSLNKLCPHFHLSLQSGCDDTLKRMNRRYTTDEYKKIVEDLRKNIKDVSITTDIIVGFPGETDEEFNTTYEFLQHIKLSKMHVFKYSPRTGTRAAEMKDQINGKIKDERSSILIALDRQLENEFMNKFVGRNMDVLYEQKHNGLEKTYEGYTPNYIKVVCESNENIKEKIVKTSLSQVKEEFIEGTMI
ncbi:tRNA (N(6)-L-threonylcarbamoyladenosine(37)-C(2))-methylthiotransferase MtaB [Clostridium sp. DJ247]|uniref:tRNA (N(6)-L-threonylcarbamoyladenosine(37)-C(2))- methylthiotransferase MtaB n=1 Tax=Clostridium sp. DJ247 TaxID=2726188 RepID=UPI0016270519|nr:tRNA (N(6)-L-threonylcarbamoyladenosine(37)-C(2))-methylthiotransferase MtaB [Clostridium sp. DJ247]MBC2579248.1 tRNA (N(6)-L-threonylcarbamoyladenosine(37)-C(2))-methylthiotransferase MtaB [Clostridium sp. DJ247]MBC2579301.1 tRNA (N(6)-L-threonylcarbamoyladenosine(37)-C(2))-methylthiotransferase MtaB [Clostridium sp. DJ247]